MTEDTPILVAEDDETDVLFLRRAFKEAEVVNPLHLARDGQEAIDFLGSTGKAVRDRLPSLVLLDLKMPRKSGMEVLKWIRTQPALCCIPVVIFSSSAHPVEIEQAYALGANLYVVKPSSTVERTELARFLKNWLRFGQAPLACTEGLAAARAAHAERDFRAL